MARSRSLTREPVIERITPGDTAQAIRWSGARVICERCGHLFSDMLLTLPHKCNSNTAKTVGRLSHGKQRKVGAP